MWSLQPFSWVTAESTTSDNSFREETFPIGHV